MTKLTREELITLVEQIRSMSACVNDMDALLCRLEQNVPDPNVSELIFNPPGGKILAADEIVDLALAKS